MDKVSKILFLALIIVVSGCQSRELNTRTSFQTGIQSFDKKGTRFEAYEGNILHTPQGMLPIEGGSYTIGQMDEFITAPRNSERRSVTVSSFYMDKYEVTNIAWREYEQWVDYVFGRYNNAMVKKVRPDTLVWRDPMAYNEPYEQNYYRHPAYSFYPVVGVTWNQAMAYCQWRTDRVNERMLVESQILEPIAYSLLDPNTYMTEQDIDAFLKLNKQHPEYARYEKVAVQVKLNDALNYGYEGEEQVEVDENGNEIEPEVTMYQLPYAWVRDHFVFNTEKYLMDTRFRPNMGRNAKLDAYGKPRKLNRADGLLLIGYRLPTEAEWEYAAFAPVASEDGVPLEGRIYPWSGYHPRDLEGKQKGLMMANFTRGGGDKSGIAGEENDGYVITAPVDAFAANDFGLYNMAGNVNEWVLDVYRETTYEEMAEYNPYRGNVYGRLKRDASNRVFITEYGCIELDYTPQEDKRNFKDGDLISRFDTDYPLDTVALFASMTAEEREAYELKLDPTDILIPRVNNHTRIYKGGSWNDRIYWLNPTTRRFMDEDACSSTVGFRCAMTMLGKDVSNNTVNK